MKYRFIMEHRKEFRLGKMCEVLGVSRSGYHNYIRNRARRKQFEYHKLLTEIKRIYSKSRGTYGSPRIYRELRKMGYLYNRKRVVRIMRENNIKAKTKRKYKVTTNSKHSSPVAENLLGQNFGCSEANSLGFRYHLHLGRGRLVILMLHNGSVLKKDCRLVLR